MGRGLAVDRDPTRTGGETPSRRCGGDHEVDVERQPGVRPQRGDDEDADRDVRHEMTVHDVHMQDIGSTLLADPGSPGEVREVSGEKRRGEFDHGKAPWAGSDDERDDIPTPQGMPWARDSARRIVPSEIPS